MGMSETHYEGLSRILRMHLHAHPKGSASHKLVLGICRDISEWIATLDENPRFTAQDFVELCSKPPE